MFSYENEHEYEEIDGHPNDPNGKNQQPRDSFKKKTNQKNNS